MKVLGFRVEVLGSRVWSSRFTVRGSRFEVWISEVGVRASRLGFMVRGLRLRGENLVIRI